MWKLNDTGCFTAPGLMALVFHNTYQEGKQGGLELIQHGERIATNGAIFLEPTPHQWSHGMTPGTRRVNREHCAVEVPLESTILAQTCTLWVWAEGSALHVRATLSGNLPEAWQDKAGLHLEIYPAAYCGETFHLDESCGILPQQANGPVIRKPDGSLKPVPLAVGRRLTLAAANPLRKIVIEQLAGGALSLYDGRIQAQNGWFTVHAGLTGGTAEWRITLHRDPAWQREPVISYSQVGYHPAQVKQAVLEFDPDFMELTPVTLERLTPDGAEPVHTGIPEPWGTFQASGYARFDFTGVQEPGLYRFRFTGRVTPAFRIGKDIYSHDVWQPTLETFFPVQMCHMAVRDRHRLWHGACHLDDARQAPPHHSHFDDYYQAGNCVAPSLTHINGLAEGGWHDAGDDDLSAGSQAATTLLLALAQEAFNVDSDQTTVDRVLGRVVLHQPDGIPDILQQITHGVENLLTGYRVAGHSFAGIISGTLEQYTLAGDTASMTDRNHPDTSRWVFTSEDSALEYRVGAALAAASRVLMQEEPALAAECISTARLIWEREHGRAPIVHCSRYVPTDIIAEEAQAAAELWFADREEKYIARLTGLWPALASRLDHVSSVPVRVFPALPQPVADDVYRTYTAYSRRLAELPAAHPYGVPYTDILWGIGWDVLFFGIQQYYLCRTWPELFDREIVLRCLNYTLGCHPASNTSLVSGVGARSLTCAYGYNRTDHSYIPGGNVPGPNRVAPGLFEFKEPFPFLWQQAEYVISGAAGYLFCVLAADQLLNG